MDEDREARVRAAPYKRWEDEGRPDGRATEHWLEAERALAHADAAPTAQQGISNHPLDEEVVEQRNLPPRYRRKSSTPRGGRSSDANERA